MLESILDYERDLFLFLNGSHTMFWDQFMWLFSSKLAWMPVVLTFAFALLYKNKERWKEILLIFVAIALVVTLCDQFASGFCKPFFARFRPTKHPDFMNDVCTVFDYRGGTYGFISSHASNAFGIATLMSLIFRNRWFSVVIFTWAIVNSYSRIYLGVHFISDIVPGIIVGILFGWIVYKLAAGSLLRSINPRHCEERSNLFPSRGLGIIILVFIFTVVVLAIISMLYSLNVIDALIIK